MRWVYVAIGLLVAYLLGFFSGSNFADRSVELVSEPLPVDAAALPPTATQRAPISDAFSTSVAQRDWAGLVAQIEEAQYNDQDELRARMRERMLEVALDYGDQDAPDTGAELLAAYVELNPHDHDALFALAELEARAENLPGAIEAVFQILDFPVTAEVSAQASALRDDLIGQWSEELAAEPAEERVAFFEYLVEREPTNDAHRLVLANEHLQAARYEQAAQVMEEIGGFGVAAEEVDALKQQLDLAVAGVPIERVDNALYARVEVNGARLRLLVDTGASKTVIVPDVLRGVRARALRQQVQLLTAGGTVSAPLFTVDSLRFGSLDLTDFEVVALESVPRATDGLLGMDLLAQVGELDLRP